MSALLYFLALFPSLVDWIAKVESVALAQQQDVLQVTCVAVFVSIHALLSESGRGQGMIKGILQTFSKGKCPHECHCHCAADCCWVRCCLNVSVLMV